MSDRTKTPPETPAAKTEHEKFELDGRLKQPGMIDMRGMSGAQQDAALIAAQISRIQEETTPIASLAQATPSEARYHTFEFVASTRQFTKHPPDWYDGKPKPCPGAGFGPAVQFHGEVTDDGEPMYLCRCPWCDVRFPPGPMPEHTFIPVRAEDVTFGDSRVMYGIEPGLEDIKIDPDPDVPGRVHVTMPVPVASQAELDVLRQAVMAHARRDPDLAARNCDGNHNWPPCLNQQCHLKAPPIFTVEARVRRVGDHIELLCAACELPLSTEESVYVGESEDEFQENLFVWHISCARKQAEPAE